MTGIALAPTIIVATMGSIGSEPDLEAVSLTGGAEVAEAFVTGARRAFMVLAALFALGLLFSLVKGEVVKGEQPQSGRPLSAAGAGDSRSGRKQGETA